MRTTRKARNARAMAVYFLEEVLRRADHHVEQLDPKNKKDYENHVLAGVAGIAAKARRALSIEKATTGKGQESA